VPHLRPQDDPYALHEPQARPLEPVAPEFARRMVEEEQLDHARDARLVAFLVWLALIVALGLFLVLPSRRDPYRSIDPAAYSADQAPDFREVSRP
jgi:hypothetical protein